MKILVDVQALQSESRHRGIGRFTLDYIKALILVAEKFNVEIYLLLNGAYNPLLTNSVINELKGFISEHKIFIWYGVPSSFVSRGDNLSLQVLYEQIRLNYIKMLNINAVLYTSLFEGYLDVAVTRISGNESFLSFSVIHDLIPLSNPVQYLDCNLDYKKWYLDRLENLKKCNGFLAISEYSKFEAIKLIDIDPTSIINISSSISKENFYCASNPIKLVNGKKYILYTGATDPRKNHFRLISAFSKLPKEILSKYVLVLAGKLPDDRSLEFQHFASNCGLSSSQVVIIGKISDEQLRGLYSGCYLYVFPSLSEGFGLPILEAMACGAAVIGSNTTSVPEVLGWKHALFDPYDDYDIQKKILQALTDDVFYSKLKKNSKKQIEKFSWQNTATKTLRYIIERLNAANKINNISYLHCNSYLSHVELCQHIASNLLESIHDKNLHLLSSDLVNIARSIDINASNFSQSRIKTIYFDITELYKSRANSGIQRVTRKILYYFSKNLNTGYNVLPIYFDEKYRKFRITMDNEFHYSIIDKIHIHDNQSISPKKGDIYIANDLILNISEAREWNVANMRNMGVKFYFMVHDILPIQFPHFFDAHFMPLFENQLNYIATYHDGIVCISKSVVEELQDWYLSLGKLVNRPIMMDYSHNGTDLLECNLQLMVSNLDYHNRDFLNDIEDMVNFIMVGTMEPRKGHIDVISVFERLINDGFLANLIIVGKYGWNISSTMEILQSSKYFNKRIFWLGEVSDDYLEALYAASKVLVAASYAEGFGLPIIEAFQRNLGVIARDIPVFREVGGDYVFYFKTKDDLLSLFKDIVTKEKKGCLNFDKGSVKFLTWLESSQSFWNIIKNSQWPYQIIQSPNHFSYSFTMRDFMHIGDAGLLGKRGIETKKISGFLIYGPYIPLNPGCYHVSIYLTHFEPSLSRVDIYNDDGVETIYESLLSSLETKQVGNTTSVDFSFHLNNLIDRLEVRIWVDDKSELSVSRVDIRSKKER